PAPTRFPYTTLFRSSVPAARGPRPGRLGGTGGGHGRGRGGPRADGPQPPPAPGSPGRPGFGGTGAARRGQVPARGNAGAAGVSKRIKDVIACSWPST